MSKKVIFTPMDQLVSDIGLSPKPAKMHVPDWFKTMPKKHEVRIGEKSTAVKCMPFVDSLTSGYIYQLPSDITFKYEGKDANGEDILSYIWASAIRPLSTRKEGFSTPNFFPKFPGYYHAEFHWFSLWEPITPKGYSTMYHHPSNRFDLPFHTMTGITDTDHWSVPGPIPFLLKEGFEGLIPAGTPIVQTTFIKRETWESETEKFNAEKRNKENFSVGRFLTGGYKKQHWQRKNFY